MGVVIRADRLQRELARRGWTYSDLARAAQASPPTVTSAMAGRPVAPRTLRRIAQALTAAAPVEGMTCSCSGGTSPNVRSRLFRVVC